MGDLQTTDELVQMLKDTGGVLIEVGWDETYGHFEILDEVAMSESQVLVQAPTCVVATGTLPKLAVDAEIVVDDERYYVQEHRKIEDGKLTRILLSKSRQG